LKRELHFDYETRSTCDLRSEGVYKYVENPTTEIICMAYAFDDGPIKIWYPIRKEPCPQEFIDAMMDPEVILSGHNSVGFEHKLTVITGRKYFPKEAIAAARPYSRWSCTAVRSAACGLPRDLDGSSIALRITEKKDKIGHQLMLTMCKPIRYDENMRPVWKEDPDSVKRLGEYCIQDVAVERQIGKMVPELSPWETRVWQATERMNDRGIMLDGPLVRRMAEFVVEAETEVNAKINRITNGRVPKVTNVAKMKAWLEDNEVEVDNLGKNTLKDLLNAHKQYEEEVEKSGGDVSFLDDQILESALPPHVKEVLLMRQSGAKSSAGKYKSAIARMNKDNRARGAMRYCGAASTSRFSSTGLQLQNLVRGSGIETYNKVEKKIDRALDVEAAIQSLMDGASVHDIERDFGPPLIVASDLVRPSFVAKPGYCIARGDYSQIEARTSCLVGNQVESLQAYRDFDTIIGVNEKGKPIRKGKDLYLLTAANVLSVLEGSLRDPDSVSPAERQTFGKVPDLACLAEGQLVLTDQGEVPIQHVTTVMKVWDGVEWVNHAGAVFKGYKECVRYDGLKATLDHLVFTDVYHDAIPFEKVIRENLYLVKPQQKHNPNRYPLSSLYLGERPVWDIIEAGTRSRFTISGRLVHNCGFGGAKGAFLAFARIYGVHISDAEADNIVKGYRAANPGKVAAWFCFERAAERCIRGTPGEIHYACTEPDDELLTNWDGTPKIGNTIIKPLAYFKRDARRMIMKMPSGGHVLYWYPRIEKRMMPWGKEKDCIMYYAQDSQKKIWRQFSAYGGLLFQNFVQRYARDVAADALVLMDERKLNPIMMVHDENLAEISLKYCDNDFKVAAGMVSDCMLARRAWIDPALPIAVEASAGPRYVKG